MAASGYTPISLYYSTSAGVAPTNTNLVNGELAINITDGKLYYKDNTGTVKVIAGAGGAGIAGGSNTQVQYNSSGSLAGDSGFTYSGGTLTLAAASALFRITPSTTTNTSNLGFTNGGGSFYVGLDSSTGGNFGAGNYGALLYNGANTPMVFFTNATERFRFGSSGQLGVGGANYGTSGQVLTSAGSGSAPTWTTPTGITTGKSIAMAMIFGF